jgi:hypothetical protein
MKRRIDLIRTEGYPLVRLRIVSHCDGTALAAEKGPDEIDGDRSVPLLHTARPISIAHLRDLHLGGIELYAPKRVRRGHQGDRLDAAQPPVRDVQTDLALVVPDVVGTGAFGVKRRHCRSCAQRNKEREEESGAKKSARSSRSRTGIGRSAMQEMSEKGTAAVH